MANYYGKVRTNYFRVTDKDIFYKLIGNLVSDDSVEVWDKTINGETYFVFGSYSDINYKVYELDSEYEDDYEYDMNVFYNEMQKIIHPDDALIITEIGNEKLRYLGATAIVITSKGCELVSLQNCALSVARELLNKKNYKTEFDY